ncbi:MAG: 3-phosphoserine/phosphohydroxythreonine transaminase [Anaerolineaceae bacterium]|nr:3-phosphoserine/phosphohydroxythreonine transaminase [Anaerolineaceae bacterium]
MKKHNFYAGPSILPQSAIDETAKAVLNYADTGLSILEISHRSSQFIQTMDETRALFKELLDVPAGYEVIFVGGGASTQFFHVPYNLMRSKAAYLDTGTWSTKAIKEAKMFGAVDVVASSADQEFSYVPSGFEIPPDADYFHVTTNNTIRGTELLVDLDSPVTMVADMSSDIFSRPVDVSKYGLIYGGAQKNLAPAGLTFVIVKEEILGKVERPIPTMVDYRTHISKESAFNTPPVICIFTALQTLKWLKENGGVKAMETRAIEKSQMLYDEIDRNKLFVGTARADSRSRMNITFVLKEEYKELEAEFNQFVSSLGMLGLKGHRSVGGFRASNYNALPKESMQALVAAMKEFEAKH